MIAFVVDEQSESQFLVVTAVSGHSNIRSAVKCRPELAAPKK